MKKYILCAVMFCSLSAMADGVENLISEIDVDFSDTAPSIGGASCPHFSDKEANLVVDAFIEKVSNFVNEYQYYVLSSVATVVTVACSVAVIAQHGRTVTERMRFDR